MTETWGTAVILLSGVIVVVGSILVLRLHAFLALILGAFTVAVLTPQAALDRYFLDDVAIQPDAWDPSTSQLRLPVGEKQGVEPGMRYDIWVNEPSQPAVKPMAKGEVTGFDPETKGAILEVTGLPSASITLDRFQVVHPLDWKAAQREANLSVSQRVAGGFGDTCYKIGILIAMATIVGKCLLESGAADRIVRWTLKLFGEPAAPVAFMSSGFLLGIPVFFDTVFYLMIPLGKAMRLRTGRNYLLYVMTIVCGATMAHSLVPPTPGPLIVAEELGVDLGTMILAGSIVGLFCAAYGYAYALWANSRWDLPLREEADDEVLASRDDADESQLPPLWLALTPIVLPVLLIGGRTVFLHDDFPLTLSTQVTRLIDTLGDKNVALILSAVIAMGTLMRQRGTSLRELAMSIQSALGSGGVIILITAAGGAFGAVLRQTGVASLIREFPDTSPAMLCTLAFLITTAIRTAQGSASVAMITAAGILSGVARGGDLGFHPVYLALAIGCGSKPVAWMNDSGFWVITRMSGMSEAEGLKYITPMTTTMGMVGLVVTLCGLMLWPNW